MSKIIIKEISEDNKEVLNLKNDSFPLLGEVECQYINKEWNYKINYFKDSEIKEETFPDENYKFEEMGSNFYGRAAYLNKKCIGIALFDNTYNKYLYLNNIMVSKEYRNTGVGKLLLDEGMKISNKLGKIGVWLVCQSSNVNAFKFYINNGYELGGIDTRRYDSTKQEGNMDLFLYKKIIN